MNEKTTPILVFAIGILVGMNWPKIEKFLKPYLKSMEGGSTEAYSVLSTFLAQQKEKVEDMAAESKIKKTKEKTEEEEVAVTRKKTIRKKKKHSLKTKAKQIINQNPKGITLQKMAEEIGVHFVRLSRPVKELIEKNKIRKEKKLYFPIS